MQILHPFAGSVAEYLEQLANSGPATVPTYCPQCQAKQPLTAHGFYTRTLVDSAFDGCIRVRRYLCEVCAGAPSRCCRSSRCRTCASASP